MHEFGVVQQLVEELVGTLRDRGIQEVKEVRLRMGSTFHEEAVRQAYEVLTRETLLQHAVLLIEEFSLQHTCPGCGAVRGISHEDLIGHLFICPGCGRAEEIDEARGLEVVSVSVEEGDPGGDA